MAGQLLPMFQELSHYWNELSRGNEQDIIRIIDEWESTRRRWLEAVNENDGLKNLIKQYDQDLLRARQDQKDLNHQLVEARVSSRRGSSFSILSDQEDVSYDNTEDNLDPPPDTSVLRNGTQWNRGSSLTLGTKRNFSTQPSVHNAYGAAYPSAPFLPDVEDQPSKKRSKGDDAAGLKTICVQPGDKIVATATLHVPYPGSPAVASAEVRRTSLNRSFSEPNIATEGGLLTPRVLSNLGKNADDGILRSYGSASALNNRRHVFLPKTVLRPEYCDQCGRRIAFGKQVYKCQECKTSAHGECKDDLPLPCIPRNTTPSKHIKGIIADFVPATAPMVPHLLVHCTNEIERRGLDSVGLYRIPGAETQVVELMEKMLWGKGVPNLRQTDDVNVLCGVIKRFLSSLKESLLTQTSWHDFARAANVKSEQNFFDRCQKARPSNIWDISNELDRHRAVKAAVEELPQPNRDTLACLISHLQRVAGNASVNLMSKPNLAKFFGPTVVGYSVDFPTPDQMMKETGMQAVVMENLLALPQDYWLGWISPSNTIPMYGTLPNQKTPDMRQGFPTGCAGTPTALTGALVTPTTPAFGSAKTRSQTKKFFQPPWK